MRKSIKNKSIKKNKPDKIKNIVFIIGIIVILCLIFFLSLKVRKTNNNTEEVFGFSSSDFKNITTIGLYEYQASLEYTGTSIIFFCSNEEKECYDEIVALDEIAKEEEVAIEYLDVIELVDSEKETLISSSYIFAEKEYPNLIVIKDKEIINLSNDYLTKDEIIALFKEYEIIE